MLWIAITRCLRDQSGTTAIEYSMIAALIAAVLIGTLAAVGGSVQQLYDDGASKAAATMAHTTDNQN